MRSLILMGAFLGLMLTGCASSVCNRCSVPGDTATKGVCTCTKGGPCTCTPGACKCMKETK